MNDKFTAFITSILKVGDNVTVDGYNKSYPVQHVSYGSRTLIINSYENFDGSKTGQTINVNEVLSINNKPINEILALVSAYETKFFKARIEQLKHGKLISRRNFYLGDPNIVNVKDMTPEHLQNFINKYDHSASKLQQECKKLLVNMIK